MHICFQSLVLKYSFLTQIKFLPDHARSTASDQATQVVFVEPRNSMHGGLEVFLRNDMFVASLLHLAFVDDIHSKLYTEVLYGKVLNFSDSNAAARSFATATVVERSDVKSIWSQRWNEVAWPSYSTASLSYTKGFERSPSYSFGDISAYKQAG